ncbi:hypothetical protein TrST_g9441 [Triparma strigata]|uniref:Vacuolar protein 8 n=1 Tax=Triparma strigata TaxID=1606541 RepID=A0A9W7EGR4_9STRA|nr:hypothetical protein TrST_g9441 [Triparma strigata]
MTLLGRQSRAAAAASERYKDVPKQGRLDALRPYLIKFRCFPENVDNVDTYPISIEELKLLVRRWNMHHERNFWRNHPDKDSVVMALYQKMKQKKEDKARKLQMQKEHSLTGESPSPRHNSKQRKHMHFGSSDEADLSSSNPIPGLNNLGLSAGFTKNLFKRHMGMEHHDLDMAGDDTHLHEAYLHAVSPEGLLVMSRTDGIAHQVDPRFLKKRSKSQYMDNGASPEQVIKSEEAPPSPTLAPSEVQDDRKIRVKRKCAAALLNMSLKEQMETQFAEEGGLESLLELALSTKDRETLTYCMSCILNLSGEGRADSKLFDFGIVKAISQLSLETSDPRVMQYCAKSLCFFTQLEDIEERLISMGIIPPLTKLTINANNPVTVMIACKGLHNISPILTGSMADSVNKHIMDCVKRLTVLNVPFLSSFSGEVVQNLSCLMNARQKIADEGAIEVLNTLIRNSPNSRTMKACAIALCNLSQLKSCTKEMVNMDVIEVITDMLKADHEETVYLCTLVLSNLTAQTELRQKVAAKNGIPVLCSLLSSKSSRTSAVASKSLANFATDENTRGAVIRSRGVPPLIGLLSGDAEGPRHDALGALCNLLSFEDTYMSVISSGVIPALKSIMHHDMHWEGISLGLFNIATWQNVHMMLVDQGGAEMLTQLLLNKELTHLIPQNLASLASLVRSSDTHEKLMKTNLVKALWVPIQNSIPEGSATAKLDRPTASKISSILMYLSTTEASAKKLVSDGAVLSLVQLARQEFEEAKMCASAMFYNLSLKKVLSDHGFLDALIATANTSDTSSPRLVWCAQTFSNLSTYPRGRTMFGKEIVKVAPCLAQMMRSGHKEASVIQRHCAIALCNSLSVWLKSSDIEEMKEKGVVQDLIVVSVLRVNVDYIKETLAKALFNLLITKDTRELMVNQGIMSSLIRLTKQVQTSEVISLCVTALQNLTCEEKLSSTYADTLMEMNAIHVLVVQTVTPMAHIEVKKMCGSALSNLSRLPTTHHYFVKEPNLCHALIKISSIRHSEEWVEKCAEVIWNLTAHTDNHQALLDQNVVQCIGHIIENGNAACRVLGVCSLANLSTNPAGYQQVSEDGMFILVATMKHTFMPIETKMNALRAVCNLVVEYPESRKTAVEEDLVPSLGMMMKSLMGAGGDGNEEDLMIVAKIMREISFYSDGHVTIQDSKGGNILLRLSKLENAEIKADVATAILNLSTCRFVTQLIEDGVIEAIYWLTLQDLLGLTKTVYERCVAIVRNLTANPKAIGRVVLESKIMMVLGKMIEYPTPLIKYHACVSLYNISCYPDSQELFVRSSPGIIHYLVALAEESDDANGLLMRSICSAALHQYPQDLLKNDPKVTNILMVLLSMDTSILDDCEVTVTDSDMATKLKKGWEVVMTSCEYAGTEVVQSWLNIVVERLLTFIPGKVEGETLKAVEVGSSDGPKLQSGSRPAGEYNKMMIEHVKQTPKDFAMPVPGAEITMEAKIELFKKENDVGADEEDDLVLSHDYHIPGSHFMGEHVAADDFSEGGEHLPVSPATTKLPPVNAPLPPAEGNLFGAEHRSSVALLTSMGSQANIGNSPKISMRSSFTTKIQGSMPLIPDSAKGISGTSETSIPGQKQIARRESMRQNFKAAQMKKAVKLENDYKDMLLLKSNNLY